MSTHRLRRADTAQRLATTVSTPTSGSNITLPRPYGSHTVSTHLSHAFVSRIPRFTSLALALALRAQNVTRTARVPASIPSVTSLSSFMYLISCRFGAPIQCCIKMTRDVIHLSWMRTVADSHACQGVLYIYGVSWCCNLFPSYP